MNFDIQNRFEGVTMAAEYGVVNLYLCACSIAVSQSILRETCINLDDRVRLEGILATDSITL